LIQEADEHQEVSIFWQAFHQVYRFALGSVAGGRCPLNDPLIN